MKENPFREARKRHWKILGDTLVKNLTAKGFEAVYAKSAEEALEEVMKLIPAGASVGVPGSVTIREIGAMEALAEKGCSVIHHWDPSLSPDERLQKLQDELLADFFLLSLSWKDEATLTASCPVMASTTRRISVGGRRFFMAASSSISSSSA